MGAHRAIQEVASIISGGPPPPQPQPQPPPGWSMMNPQGGGGDTSRGPTTTTTATYGQPPGWPNPFEMYGAGGPVLLNSRHSSSHSHSHLRAIGWDTEDHRLNRHLHLSSSSLPATRLNSLLHHPACTDSSSRWEEEAMEGRKEATEEGHHLLNGHGRWRYSSSSSSKGARLERRPVLRSLRR